MKSKLLALTTTFFASAVFTFADPQAGQTASSAVEKIAWKPWTPKAVEKARAEGRPVLVDFTADWCLSCQANKKTSIEIPSVRQKLKEINGVAFIANNTDVDPHIVAELKKYGRAGVPLVLVFPKDPSKPAIVLPEGIFPPSKMLAALDEASK